jgi:hypothetical protein
MISIIERVVKFKELIIALTSLAASVTAIIKIYDDTQAKKQYDILRESVIELSKNSERNHEDIASIHNYLAGVNGDPIPVGDDIELGKSDDSCIEMPQQTIHVPVPVKKVVTKLPPISKKYKAVSTPPAFNKI